MGLAFLTETVAFDLCVVNERAYDLHAPARDELLQLFLEVDKEAELDQQEPSLRGVRKAQVKLATYYLQKGEEDCRRRPRRKHENALRPFDEFGRQRLLPRRLNGLGPVLATADVNGDGVADVFVTGTAGQAGALPRPERRLLRSGRRPAVGGGARGRRCWRRFRRPER